MRPCPKFPASSEREGYRKWRMKATHWLWQMRRAGVCDSLLGNELLTALSNAPSGIENLVLSMDQDTLGFAGRPANWILGDPGQRSGVMEGIARLDARFLVDAFDESIAQLDRFYDLQRKGRMAEYLADFLQVYSDAQIGAGLGLDDSSLTWHLLKGAHVSTEERRIIMAQVGGNYSRFQDIYNLLADSLSRLAGIDLHDGKTQVWNRAGIRPPRLEGLGGQQGAWRLLPQLR